MLIYLKLKEIVIPVESAILRVNDNNEVVATVGGQEVTIKKCDSRYQACDYMEWILDRYSKGTKIMTTFSQ